MNTSIKCPQCGLVNFSTEEKCERCQAELPKATQPDVLPVQTEQRRQNLNLLPCPDCQHMISAQAEACPQCGRFIKRPLTTFTPSGLSRSQAGLIIVLLLLGVGLYTWNTFRLAPLPPPTWEYRIEAVPDEGFTEVINDLGKEGWELVFARRASSDMSMNKPVFSYEMIFKRQVK